MPRWVGPSDHRWDHHQRVARLHGVPQMSASDIHVNAAHQTLADIEYEHKA